MIILLEENDLQRSASLFKSNMNQQLTGLPSRFIYEAEIVLTIDKKDLSNIKII